MGYGAHNALSLRYLKKYLLYLKRVLDWLSSKASYQKFTIIKLSKFKQKFFPKILFIKSFILELSKLMGIMNKN